MIMHEVLFQLKSCIPFYNFTYKQQISDSFNPHALEIEGLWCRLQENFPVSNMHTVLNLQVKEAI